ncbi:aldehyde dehydrogenase (NADP(+)) [Galbibacter sp. EGI 63066]|uniref:aldehyde dehydrogenase (NADP(+)) n=1 Tax=Galbibacter sp. EGI 63066 TaxID=2993559 RepID=UPI002248AB1F|nr:aldehyde dehydrogenase (NADP(+)) [Galbibacter sp. EGI 63066]MCX2678627.1 aldehyde dehydrogenase (NADP(+)) [Galbibacter sp. EGI 63066]
MITGKNYIGEGLSALGAITYKTINPETNSENETTFYEATSEEVNKAVTLADKAFDVYKKTSDAERATFLEAIAQELETIKDDLVEIYKKESGLPDGRANGELARTTGQLRAFAAMLKDGSWVEAIINKSEGKPDLRRMQIPIGPIVVFGASNFPFAFSTAGGDTASALAAGCPVIVKSHPLHAGTGELVASAIVKAARKTKMPNGVFSNMNSKGIEVGKLLVQHPLVKAVGFTGSIKGGTALCKLASEREEPIPVYAEMGSINPVVILPSALKDKAQYWGKQYAGSITAGTGQFCTNPGLMLGIKSKALDQFVVALGEATSEIAPACMLHPSIKAQYDKNKEEVLSQPGFNPVTTLDVKLKDNYALQHIIAVDAEVFLKNKTYHKEVFGPFSIIVQCDDKDQLTKVLEAMEGQLTGTILNEDPKELFDFSETIEALKSRVGRLIFNGVPTGVDVSAAMTHGGPFPASSDSKYTSVGLTAVKRWVRPVSYQDWPDALLPKALQNSNPLQILRTINGEVTKNAL